MLFKKTAQKEEKQNKSAYISTLADSYLQFTLKLLEDQKVKDAIKGKFPNLKYTLTGYDPSDLNYEDKVNLIAELFNLSVKERGMSPAKEDLEKLGLQVKDRLGVIDAFNEGIKDMPKGVFEVHKIDGLNAEELREKLKQCVYELEKAKTTGNESLTSTTTELVAEKEVLESILYNTSDGIYALDRQGKIITFNKAMEDLTGYTFDEVNLKPADEIIRIFDESNPLETRLYCALPGSTPQKNVYTNDKITLVARNGGKKYVKMNSTVATEAKDINIGCVVTLKDITKDIELETMKLDFVSIAAHELRTPLTAMRGYLSFLKDDIKKDLDEMHAAYLDKTAVAADQLYVLIENLLNISRIERGTLVLEKTKQNWVQLIKRTVDQFIPNAESAGVTLTFVESKMEIPEVTVDPTMISEVVSNLLDNAIRYTPEGGRISVFVETSEGNMVTHVKDTGIGIPQASIPHLFKKFYRVSTVLKEGKKGTGLGLFISKEIVKLHKGDIWVESKEGEGSTFSFSIPLDSSPTGNNVINSSQSA